MGKGTIARTMADLLAQAKDLAEAARIQRAIDAGRNQILYHGTHTDFPAVDPSKVDLGLHVGTSEQATNRLADIYKRQDLFAKRGSNKFSEGAQIMPLAVRPGKSLEMSDVGEWDDAFQTGMALRRHPAMAKHRDVFDELLESLELLRGQHWAKAGAATPQDKAVSWANSEDNRRALQELNSLLVGDGYGSVKYLNEAENTHGTAGEILPEHAEQLNQARSAADDLRKLAAERKKQAAHAAITNRETAEQLLKYPKSPLGYLMPEERELFDKYASQISDMEMDPAYRSDPNSYIILNPHDQRSINAQFDPEFDLSPDLMKAEGGLVDVPQEFGKGGVVRAIKEGADAIIGERPLKGAPEAANIPGLGRTIVGPNPKAEEVAQRYAAESGIPYEPLKEYPPLRPELSKRIAAEYDRMPAAPDDKEVKRAYDALIQETMGQYEEMLRAGVKPYFIDGPDPYAASPYLALKELHDTNRIGVFPTVEGFGSDAAFDPKNNPLLASTPYKISGRPALANDIFRAVHDYMGHAKPGVGFRAAGEEAAYQSHAGMFSPLARRALASETRGQNSWLNYGPFGEKNRSARIEDTIFADQKAGLLPRWAAEEGRTSAVDRRARFQRALRDGNTGLEGALTPEGRLALQHYSDKQLDRIDPAFYGTGLSGSTRAEMNRVGDRNFMDRWYAGLETDVDPYMIEGGLGPYKHTMLIDPELMYPLRYPNLDDPEHLWRTGKPALSEKRIADQNYSGYYFNHPALGNVGVMFDALDVKKADGGLVELANKYAAGGPVQKYAKGDIVRQWLKGYPEKSLAPLKRADVEKPEAAALNNWIDTSLAKYIKRDYGSPNDPLALLAPEQRHVPLMNENLRAAQTNAVWPPKEFDTPAGRVPYVGGIDNRYLLESPNHPAAIENPWISTLAPETQLYRAVDTNQLGLQHLRDELYNAIRPDSDLPEQLRLRPESLPRVSVAQASQLVGKINAWRAANKAKADLAMSMNPATFIHKEYPEQNMRWVQLRAPDELKALPEGYSLGPSSDMSRQSGRFVLRHPDGKESALGSYATEQDAIKKALSVIEGDDRFEQLQKALKYEGDTMGHCVGGYCDSVFDGRSNIYSLRDARGEPHVTVEVSKDDWISGEAMEEIIPGSFEGYRSQMNNFDGIASIHDYIKQKHPEMYEQLTRPSIAQIKGKSNNKPVDKYLPFVQDFVRSQKWGDIGDFENTGLIKRDYAGKYLEPVGITTDESLRRSLAFDKATKAGKLPEMFSQQELEDILKLHNPDDAELAAYNADMDHLFGKNTPGMKEGGEVKDKSVVDKFLDSIRTGAAGFATQYTPDEHGNIGLASSMLALPELADLVSAGSAPEWSRVASQDYDTHLNNMLARYGLPASADLPAADKYMLAAGEMLGQLPVPGKLFSKVAAKAPKLAKGATKAIGTLVDYFGPTVAPSAAVYGIGAGVGGTLRNAGSIAGGMMSLAERYGLGSDQSIDADESDRLLASLGIESAGRKIDNAGIDRYIAESEAREAARDRIAANVYDYLPEYAKGGLFADALKEYPQLRKIAPYLSDEEKALFDTPQWRKQSENTINIYKQIPPAREMASVAKAGGAKKGWYKDSYNSIQSVFENAEYPDDPERFTALLAALSPQTSVESNLKNALATWKNWLAAGRPQDADQILKVMGDSVGGDKGTESVLGAWRNNSYRALMSPDARKMLGDSGLSGPKVQSFLRNLAGDFGEVTNDAWMAKLSSISQQLFGGQNRASFADEIGDVGIKGPGYLAQSAKQRQAAELLGWDPAEVQEAGWSFGKTLSDLAGQPNYVIKSMEGSGIAVPEMYRGLPVQTAEEALRGGFLTDEAIGATPAFGDLMHLPAYSDLLTGAGYNLPARSTAVKQFTSPYDRISTPPSDLARTSEGRDLIMASRRIDKMQRRSDAYRAVDMANELSALAATERDRRSAAQRLNQGLRMLQRSASELPNVDIDPAYRRHFDNKAMGGLVEKYGALTEQSATHNNVTGTQHGR